MYQSLKQRRGELDVPSAAEEFETASPRLLGLAYRILGSVTDAEDAVQDCFEKWMKADRSAIGNPLAWLTTICTRRCIDMARAHDRSRVDYIGAWLPEPLQVSTPATAEESISLASSLNTAFLLVLERLSPKERAAYLLRDIFDLTYVEVAHILGISEAACRKLVSRARENVSRSKSRYAASADKQREFLAAFRQAVDTGETGALAALLAKDVRLTADSGGKVAALRETLVGNADVLAFVGGKLGRFWSGADWHHATINGTAGYVLFRDATVFASLSVTAGSDDRITGIYIMRNPDKFVGLRPTSIH